MKKAELLFLLSFAALIGLLGACTAEMENPVQGEPCTIVGQIDEVVATRTCVDESISTRVDILWQPEEKIGVYSNSTNNAEFTSTNTETAGKAEFNGTIDGEPMYAYYPYNEANNSTVVEGYKSVAGELPLVQEYSSSAKTLSYDWKVGTPTVNENSDYKTFAFRHIFALIRFTINATGTALEGDRLKSISLSFPDDVTLKEGAFTVDLSAAKPEAKFENEAADSKTLTMVWTGEQPELTSGAQYNGYITSAPINSFEKEVTVTISTENFTATFNTTLRANIEANRAYTFPLDLQQWAETLGEEGFKVDPVVPEGPVEIPEIFSLSFNAEANVPTDGSKACPILKRKVYAKNTSSKSTTYTDADAAYSTHEATLQDNVFSVYIPYLNDRNLVPTFDYTEGAKIQVNEGEGFVEYVEGTTINFLTNPVIRVIKGSGYQDYTVNLTNTGLPVVVISQPTEGLSSTSWSETGLNVVLKSSDWPTNATVTFYKADGTPEHSVELSGVRLRGNTTMDLPKRPFAIKLDKKKDVFGMGKHKRWVLLANWKDHTLMRNKVVFDIANIVADAYPTGTENDGIGWQPTGTFVELVYNNVHVGNYYLCEQIKIEPGVRVDIKDPYDPEDGAFTAVEDYGYLLECDDAYDEAIKFTTRHYIPFQFKDDTDSEGKMLSYIQEKVQRIEDNLYNGYKGNAESFTSAYAEMDLYSMIDYWIIQELAMNGEIKHPKSVYMIMDGSGKLKAGPVWDFDWQTFPIIENLSSGWFSSFAYSYTKSMVANADHHRMSSGLPSEPNFESDAPYMWYPLLFKSDEFKNVAAERWGKVKELISSYTSQISEIGKSINTSWEVNQAMWPNNKSVIQDQWPLNHALCGDENYTFEEAYNAMATTIQTRINGMSFIDSKTYPSPSVK